MHDCQEETLPRAEIEAGTYYIVAPYWLKATMDADVQRRFKPGDQIYVEEVVRECSSRFHQCLDCKGRIRIQGIAELLCINYGGEDVGYYYPFRREVSCPDSKDLNLWQM